MGGNLIQCHSILFEGEGELAQTEMKIGNIETEPANVGVGSIFDQLLIGREGFREEAAAGVLIGQIELDEESQVVVGLADGRLLPLAHQTFLLVKGLFRPIQR